MLNSPHTRGESWPAWFLLVNVIAAYVYCLPYLTTSFPWHLPFVKPVGMLLVWIFIVISYLGHLAFLFALSALPSWLLSRLPIKPFVYKSVLVVSITALSLYLLSDSQIYALYRFHLNSTLLSLVFAGHFQAFLGLTSQEITRLLALVALVIAAQIALAFYLSRKSLINGGKNWLKRAALTAFGCLCFSYLILFWSLGLGGGTNVFSQQIYSLPLYSRFFASLLPYENSEKMVREIGSGFFAQPKQAEAPLNYPRHPLSGQKPKDPLNIIVIGVDSLRADMVTKEVMPNTYRFAQSALRFKQHYSGGNGTQTGIFSLFYGLPANYWTATINQQTPPLLLQNLKQQGYRLGIFWSNNLEVPPFAKNVYAGVKPLRVESAPGDNPAEQDKYITRETLDFIDAAKQSKQPFFSFTFYLSVHSYCLAKPSEQRFKPIAKECQRILFKRQQQRLPMLNRYRNAAFAVDKQIGWLLAQLKQRGLFERSVIIITSDHGEEFNDNNNGYWGHAGNFSRYQTQVPLLIHWPGKPAADISYQTSHYDLVPTLLSRLAGVNNPFDDYSIGSDLFSQHQNDALLVGSYINFGMIEPKQLTVLYQTGGFEVQDLTSKPQPGWPVDKKHVSNALTLMRRFYR